MTERYGWKGSISSFLEITDDEIIDRLSIQHINEFKSDPNHQQIAAWKNSLGILRTEMKKLVDHRKDSEEWVLVFEYELLREGSRRPDVVLLDGEYIIVVEFKDYDKIHTSHIDQVQEYVRDIQNYHSESRNLRVVPILIPTRWNGKPKKKKDVVITPSSSLTEKLKEITKDTKGIIDSEKWINGEFSPLPSIVTAARLIFNHRPLPQIKRAHSAGIPDTLEKLLEVVKEAEKDNEFHIALVTGVPGAGKTLVGLQFAYNYAKSMDEVGAVFLSGNGPLIEVLRHALKKGSKAFVQDIHKFLKEYGGDSDKVPKEHVWIYDEAQRAWDAAQVMRKRGHDTSEPEDFVKIADKIGSWSTVIGLIGEGQNIYVGEEGGIEQWASALKKSKKKWTVHCPKKIAHYFEGYQVDVSDSLDLSTSLRSHIAEDVHEWVRTLLEGNVDRAKEISAKMASEGFDLYVTRDLDVAKQYVKERYFGDEDKRFGLIASSKSSVLPKHGVDNDFLSTRKVKVGPWYNDSPSSEKSCCQMNSVVTEFACQGLELDMPIVCWEDDLIWKDGKWLMTKRKPRNQKDPYSLRVNSYRVLLTRGRDGMVIFVPNETVLNEVYNLLMSAGAAELKIVDVSKEAPGQTSDALN